ncbi:MAG TPA: glutamine synthetase, partial [Acidimicrobiia bacterium]|nr:glutamine synthetase [Acidimicrobiia bacterium]
YELPPEISANIHLMTPAERAAAGAKRLPETLSEALDLMEGSELIAEALGEHVFDWFLRNKRKEWDRYQHHVSRFELESYLPVL